MSNLTLEDIAEVTGGRQYDRYVACNCYWHNDFSPSLFIYLDTFKCTSCGHFGNTSQLIHQLKTNVIPHRPRVANNNQPRNPITRWINVYGSLAKAMQIAHKQLMKRPSVYLTEQRKISHLTCKSLGIGMLDSWITFPVFDIQHRVIGCTIRIGGHAPYRLFMNPRGQSPDLLYDPDPKRTAQAKKLYLVFGIVDIVSLWQIGCAGFSTTTGKRLNVEALEQYRKDIIIIPDVGEEAEAHHIANQLGWRGHVQHMPEFENVKDCNDLLVRQPKALYSFIGV